MRELYVVNRVTVLISVVASVVVLMATFMSISYPWLVLALPAAGSAIYAIGKPLGRIAIFAGGALAVFQSSSGASAVKLVYFAAALVVVLIAVIRCGAHMKTEWGALFKPALRGALLLVVLVLIAFTVGTLIMGVPVTEAARDGITYLMIAAAVPLAIDGASTMNRKSVRVVTVIITLLAAVSFAVLFLAARGVSSLSVERIGLASMMALSIGVSMGFVLGLGGRGVKMVWLLYVALLLACVLITGSRGGLILLAALVGVVGASRNARVPASKLFLGLVVCASGIVAALMVAAPNLTSAGFLQSRIDASILVMTEGAGQDTSGYIRARATGFALDAWNRYPILGVGLGHRFPDPTPGGYMVDFQLDTAATFLAKFGLIGTVLLFIALALIATPAFRVHKNLQPRLPEQAMMTGALAVWVATLIFGAPTEDKGFSLAVLMCLLMLASAFRTKPSLEDLAASPDEQLPTPVGGTSYLISARKAIKFTRPTPAAKL
ncbi:O-antigen ligase family protein [Pseudarthrobacter sp. B907]|uniref:O-antigen ligase family protein n=1 Tax=Pseudarthrobacter sp. B907 TaxID=3158261 RepID=UPI0032DB83F3